MKKILIPTDFSKHAEYALEAASQIAKKNGSEIFLLHMLELPNQMSDAIEKGSSIPEVLFFIKKAHEKFDAIKNQDFLKEIPVTEAVQFQKAFDGIMEFSKKQNIDLIVMGSHGSKGLEEIFIGSNAEKVIRTSEIPVLVIKNHYNVSSTKNVVLASDFTEKAKNALTKAIRFTGTLDAHLNFLLVNTPNHFKSTAEAEKIMNNFVKELNLSPELYSLHLYNDLSVEKGILNFADKINADLIAMSTHGRKGLDHFFNGSISEDLVNHSKKPVITFKI